MFDDYAIEKIKEIVSENVGDREIVFYGKNNSRMDELGKVGINISKIFTSNQKIINSTDKGIDKFPHTDLNGKSSRYYVLLPLILNQNKEKQKSTLAKFGYEEYKDYCFLDLNTGNSITGDLANIQVIVDGCDNIIEVDEGCKNLTIKVTGNCNNIKIKKVSFSVSPSKSLIKIFGSNSYVLIKNDCSFIDCKITLFSNCFLAIDEKSTFNSNCSITLQKNSVCTIGKDCMLSCDVILQGHDAHSIFDVKTKENINSFMDINDTYLAYLKIHDHIWVGRDSMILAAGNNTTEIMDGSIVGAKSFVKGKFPNNCIIAGCPARIIKRDIAWSRKNGSSDISDCGEYVHNTQDV